MIDFRVAADKIAQFQTADEVASFFREQGVRGVPESGSHCAIAQYMQNETSEGIFVGVLSVFLNAPLKNGVIQLQGADDYYDHTPAMKAFVIRFDQGAYPDLVASEPKSSP